MKTSQHSNYWYSQLSIRCGHRGFVRLDEIRKAEAEGWEPVSPEFRGHTTERKSRKETDAGNPE